MAMKSRRNILAVSVIAMAVAIAGCSSSDDKKTVGGAPSGPTQAELDAAKAVAAGYAAAHTSKADAEAAGEAAAGAVTEATKYSGMLDIKSVTGESAKAIENAQKVLAAQSSAVQAVGKAEAALESAKNAKTTATGKLPEDHEDRANLMAALDAAIAAAQEQVKAAKASHEGSALKAAVRAV